MNREPKCRWDRIMYRSNSILFRVLLFTVFAGLASPFALGESSSGSKGSIFRKPRTLAGQVSTAGPDKQKSRARLFLKNFDLRSRRNNGVAKNHGASLTVASRLLFSYVTPMLDLALNRTLTEEDAFAVPEAKKMEYSVEELAGVYERFRKEADKSAATNRGGGMDKLNKSKSFILFKAIVYHQRHQLILTGLLRLVNTIIQAFPAVLVSRLLKCIEAGSAFPAYKAVTAAILLVSVLCLKMIIENQFFHNVVQMSTQTRGSLEGLIFDKSLRLPDGGSGVLAKRKKDKQKKALGSGGVLNLMQSDASTIESAVMQIHTTWDGLLQIAIYTSLLFKYLGPSVFWGISVLLSVIPLNSVTLRLLDRLTQRENEAKDARTKRTTESITNMKLLKVQAWEDRFAEDIRQHRRDELSRHKARGVVRGINSAISNCVPSIVLVVTLTAYARTGNPIVASTIFTAISLFNQLRFPLFFYPMLVDSLANGKNSLRRVSSYLTSEELTPYTEKLPSNDGGSIEVENGNFLWPSSDAPKDGHVSTPDSPALCNVKLKVNSGEIVAVIGSVGSGKSALLLACLGELAPVPRMVVDSEGSTNRDRASVLIDRPKVKSNGIVAYCSQDAWIPKGTIRNAVIFGRDYDDDRYAAAIYDAGLDQDIENGVFSHETDVGEGGSSLSGGQRARVALARALYSGDDTKVFLLDDCLAALDASMGSLVFERLKTRLKRSNAATLLVTNDPSLPRQCDRVVLMGKKLGGTSSSSCSTAIDIGTYDDLLSRGHELSNIAESQDGDEKITASSLDPRDENSQEEGKHDDRSNRVVQLVKQENLNVVSPIDRSIFESDAEHGQDPILSNHERADDGSDDIEVSSSRDSKILSADEQMSTGAVPMKTYTSYLKAVRSPKLIAAMLVAFVATNGAQFFQQYTVAKWTELAHGDAVAGALGGQYLKSLIYAAGAVSAFLWFRSYFTMLVGLRASDFYHDRMVRSVFRAPMSFFDSTPSGQILSRFGKEMETIDRALPESYASVLFCALQISSSVFALAGAVTPTMVVPIMFASSLYYRTMRRFRRAARDMKRSETKTRSPIFTHFGETLRGTATIRSIPGAPRAWSTAHRKLSDSNLSVYSTVKALDRWLSTRLEALGNFMVLSTAIASVILSRSGRLLPGKAGWGLTQSLAITGLMAWAVRNLTMLESHMMSVMRVREMTDLDEIDESLDKTTSPKLMPRELSGPGDALKVQFIENAGKMLSAPRDEKALIAAGWPWKGGLSFQNVSMRYNSASPLVLKKLSIDVPPGSTLGVVGRTGSGKSSLLLTLFRIIEIETGGSIQIDSVDIRSVGLKALRESLSIIPQDPVLFTGTVRTNLDPTSKRSNDEMWKSLESASPELAKQFHSAAGLETPIAEGGSNLSQGQRQLLCLARALLRSSKILVLDEATSSVDAGTDKQVQDTIRSQFVDKGVTVITVAHRLDTIMNYDKVAVLGDGSLIEYGVPSVLANQSGGEFKRLVDADKKNKMRGSKSEKEGLIPM